jgi:hypothetical protein
VTNLAPLQVLKELPKLKKINLHYSTPEKAIQTIEALKLTNF